MWIKNHWELVQNQNAVHVASQVSITQKKYAKLGLQICLDAARDAAKGGRSSYFQGKFSRKELDETFRNSVATFVIPAVITLTATPVFCIMGVGYLKKPSSTPQFDNAIKPGPG